MDYEPEIKTEENKKTVDTLKLHYFEEFIQLTKNKNIELVCCSSPYYKAPLVDSNYEPIIQLCKKNNVPFLYYGACSGISDEKDLFQDRTHMNDTGARLFTSKLISFIKS